MWKLTLLALLTLPAHLPAVAAAPIEGCAPAVPACVTDHEFRDPECRDDDRGFASTGLFATLLIVQVGAAGYRYCAVSNRGNYGAHGAHAYVNSPSQDVEIAAAWSEQGWNDENECTINARAYLVVVDRRATLACPVAPPELPWGRMLP